MQRFLSSRRHCIVQLTHSSSKDSMRGRIFLIGMINHDTRKHFSTMLLLSEANVRQCLDMQECIETNRKALIAISSGDAIVPTRLALPYQTVRRDNDGKSSDTADDWTLFKPASLRQRTGTIDDTTAAYSNSETVSMGMKVVSVRASNVQTGHPLVPATILHINPSTGIVDAIVAATYLTAARTAAGSAIAIHHYFKTHAVVSDSENITPPLRPQHVVVFGAGLQAEQHIRAIACIFQYCIPSVTIINRNTQRAEILKDRFISEQLATSVSVEPLLSQNSERIERTILLSADVIVACTNTITPLWASTTGAETEKWANKFCIIAGIGSYTPSMQEIPKHVVDACQQIWIDTSEATKVGDLKHLSVVSDSSSAQRPPRLLGSVLVHQHESKQIDPRTSQQGLVFYKAVGTAIQDVLTADDIVNKATRLGIGNNIDMS